MKYFFFLTMVTFFFLSCKQKQTLFREVKSNRSGIHFNNKITEDAELNVMNYEYIYNGGGVAIGDINNDGKPDIVLGNYAKGFMFQQGLTPFWDPNLPFIVLENHIKK